MTGKESEAAAAAALSRSRDFEILLENNILRTSEKFRNDLRGLPGERRLTKLKHDTKNSETHCWHKWRLDEETLAAPPT